MGGGIFGELSMRCLVLIVCASCSFPTVTYYTDDAAPDDGSSEVSSSDAPIDTGMDTGAEDAGADVAPQTCFDGGGLMCSGLGIVCCQTSTSANYGMCVLVAECV
jgi:hypothetical protein